MTGDDKIRIAGIMKESIVDGPGIRLAVFCQGCPHSCEGCHNPQSHDFAGGYDMSISEILEEFDKNPLLSGITFSGGEPMCQPVPFAALSEAVKKRGKTVTIFSGYTFEELLERARGIKDELTFEERKATAYLLRTCDILIDGRFQLERRDLTLKYRGSDNQRVIDMNKSRKTGEICLYD